MIPESIHLRNFLSHRETDLDLRGVHLASLVGENGAGKTALLDGITWAVWGRSRAPYGHDDDLVYHGETSLEVEYVFRMPYQDGSENRCRILRRREHRGRRSVSSILDFQVESDAGWRILTADSIRETQQRIIDHLGLDYDTFVNSAYLRQGHADEFTVQSPGQRKKVLSAVLGLDQWAVYQDRARARLSEANGELSEVNRRLSEIAAELDQRPAFEAQLEEAEAEALAADAELQQAQAEMDDLTRVREHAAALQRQLADIERRREDVEREAKALAADLDAHRERLAYYEGLMDRAAAIEDAYRAHQRALAEERAFSQALGRAAQLQARKAALEGEIASARDTVTVALHTAEREVDRLAQAIRDAASHIERELTDLRAQVTLLEERIPDESLSEQLATAAARVAEAEAAAEALDGARAQQREQEVEQSRLRERNRQLHEAMDETKVRLETLRQAEADCPLCGQPLSPDHQREVLAEIEAEGRAMGDEYRENRNRMDALSKRQEESVSRIASLSQQLRSRSSLENALARLQQQAEEGEVARQRATALRTKVGALEERLASADFALDVRADLREASGERDRLQVELDEGDFRREARAALAEVTEALASVGYDRDAHAAVQRRIEALRHAEVELRELEKARVGQQGAAAAIAGIEAQLAALEDRKERLTQERAKHEDDLAEMAPVLARAPQVSEELTAARQRVLDARQDVGAARQTLAALVTLSTRRDAVQNQRASLAQRVGILTELREAFGVNGIPAMIIEHTMPELERDANRVLQQLTGGRLHVRFDTQRETKSGNLRETLDIIISDEKGTRPYESFSGGEKFRVNFAIRVALSRMLARRSGVRLRSLFVDEGFGTLDADGRQRLVESVKAVQSDFDLVLIITHIDELREAFPTQIQVIKTDSGSHVEVV